MAMNPFTQASTGKHQMPRVVAPAEARNEIQACVTQAALWAAGKSG